MMYTWNEHKAAMVELHCHTKISDNSFTTEEVIRMAKEAGVTHLAITNHDTTMGLREAMALGEQYGVEVIPGIEISAYDYKRGRRSHFLGFYVEPNHAAIEELCAPLRVSRHEACRVMVERIREVGYNIDWGQVQSYAQGGTGVYKQHIMHALIDRGYTDSIYSPLYKMLFARGGDGKEPGIAYVPLTYVDAFDAIRTILAAGGVPVLAHPGQMDNYDAVPEWAEAGLMGIEVKHPDHSAIDEARARALAHEYGLIMTGGSDFHGFYGNKPSPLGSQSLGIQCVDAIKEKKLHRK
ncbi:PHP domain-containing protein [Paenibacillus terrae HPL-003]|uniref:PHP domain-containing protein n=1 Tax=Paenibacillus terrae (strain HPL-003) TaxID=985665 RepID=G7VPQ6_PAETH|nr:PHP domain-containing protein [Paenibacillus terrae]AET61054.1 PHP domain-containing protein [Paenibacillus terrae HPL-003]